MISISYTNDYFFDLAAREGVTCLFNANYLENSSNFAIQGEDILIIKNYFEDKDTFELIENLVKREDLYIVYLPRSIKNKESYALVTKSQFIHSKLNSYLNLFKIKVAAIYQFSNYLDREWNRVIMGECVCEKLMNDMCIKLFDTTIIPFDFVDIIPSTPGVENSLLVQKFLDFSDKVVCSERVTQTLKKMNIEVDPEKFVLHPHLWGTSNLHDMVYVEENYGYKIPYKNMCFLHHRQCISKSENSFIGLYINKDIDLPIKSKDILLRAKHIDLVLGHFDIDKKISLIDKLCESRKVYLTVLNDDPFEKFKDLLVNKANFINFGILDRDEYLDKLKEFKIYLSLDMDTGNNIGYVEAMAAGCHIVSSKAFADCVIGSINSDLDNSYSIYNDINEIEELINNIIIKNSYQSKVIDVFDKYNYINRVINIINGYHTTTGVIYI